jgi:catechol 2,3-dioxygenase-like lactoylglutathione lyase family enzyme
MGDATGLAEALLGLDGFRVLNHLGISVSDLDRSIAFYCDVLGGALAIPPREGHSTLSSWRFAVVGLGSLALDIYQHSDNGGERWILVSCAPETPAGRHHL